MFSAFQTFGRLGAGARAVAAAWSPSALWPTGTEPGMWIDPSNLTSQWQDSTGTTPVSPPGTVADSSNPVGLALDLRLGALDALGPELVVNGDFSAGGSDWEVAYGIPSCAQFIDSRLEIVEPCAFLIYQNIGPISQSKIYEVSWYQYSPGGGRFIISIGDVGWWLLTEGTGQKTFRVSPGGSGQFVAVGQGGTSPGDWCDNISVREVPGNHLLQATSTARPLESARVNLLTYTEDFSNAVWQLLFGLEKTPNYGLAPDGTMTACRLYAPTTDGVLFGHGGVNASLTRGAWMKSNTSSSYTVTLITTPCTVTPTWTFFEAPFNGNEYRWNMSVPAAGDISIWHPQVELGTTATTYQRVTTDSDYDGDPTGFPIYQHFDGTDDGMATASFAAGTLTSDMDCMIAVRRDAAGNAVCGLYESVAEANKVFGIAESGSGSGCVGSGAGTPTVWVDGVQLTGGTAVTRGTLHTALTVGDYHVLEFRGLDLSTWAASGFGLYTSYVLNGALGGILLFPSSTPTADRDAARTWLGAKVGLTL